MKLPRLILLLSLFSESQHSLKDCNHRRYNSMTLSGYFLSLVQLILPFFSLLHNLLTFSSKYFQTESGQFLLFSPLNQNVRSSHYFFRFFDTSKADFDRLYVQTNSPSPYIKLKNLNFIKLLPLEIYLLILFYFLFIIPLNQFSDRHRKRYLVCDPSAIRNLFLYYTAINFFESFNNPPCVLVTFEGHAWEYSILLAYSLVFRSKSPKTYIAYQHAPLTFDKSSHLDNNSFLKYCSFRKVLPSGPSVTTSFKNFSLYNNFSISDMHIFSQTLNHESFECFTDKLLFNNILCVPEAIDSEFDLYCRFLSLILPLDFTFSIRIQNTFFNHAFNHVKSFFPNLLPFLVSSNQLSLMDHCSNFDVCVTRGSSAAIECVQVGLIPIFLTESNGCNNNVFWPIKDSLGMLVYPDLSSAHILAAINTSHSNIKLIRKFAYSYYVRYLLS